MTTEIKFEKALEQLEKIVEDLESGSLNLEDALKRYEEGVKLSRLCSQKLQQAENKIEILTKVLNGQLESQSLGDSEGAEETESKKGLPAGRQGKKSSKKSASNEDDFLL